ncbi:MAG: homoserine dehydrogenase [Firmicutes bacterium]|jgi:homoserine dehydrogenase|nr:homoserine dehydrogenase [Bacillota bacterium]
MSHRPINLGLLGFGTVGTGVYRVLKENSNEIAARTGAPILVKRVLIRDPAKERNVPYPEGMMTTDPEDVLSDPEIDIIVEVIGNSHPALEYILRAVESGRHVVTANKEAIAKFGDRIFDAAAKSGVDIRFEGSVAGGIPIIKSIKDSLAANRIESIVGIVNGTTNYILTKMTEQGAEFAQALSEAQRLGYAEADPANDVDGHDAAYKLAILASVAFGVPVHPQMVCREGITRITASDIKYAAELGYVVKLLAVARNRAGALELSVGPSLVRRSHPLAAVSGSYNAVFVQGNASGDLVFSGRGAGDLPTASAVVADIIEIAEGIVNRRGAHNWRYAGSKAKVFPPDDVLGGFYVRTVVDDRPGVLAGIAQVFADNMVSLQSVIQKGRQDPVDLVFVTHSGRVGALRAAVERIREFSFVHEVPAVIRTMEDPD